MPAVRERLAPAPGRRNAPGRPRSGALARRLRRDQRPEALRVRVLRGRVARVGRHDDARREPVEALRDRGAVGEDDVGLVPVARDAVDEDVDVQDGVRAAQRGQEAAADRSS